MTIKLNVIILVLVSAMQMSYGMEKSEKKAGFWARKKDKQIALRRQSGVIESVNESAHAPVQQATVPSLKKEKFSLFKSLKKQHKSADAGAAAALLRENATTSIVSAAGEQGDMHNQDEIDPQIVALLALGRKITPQDVADAQSLQKDDGQEYKARPASLQGSAALHQIARKASVVKVSFNGRAPGRDSQTEQSAQELLGKLGKGSLEMSLEPSPRSEEVATQSDELPDAENVAQEEQTVSVPDVSDAALEEHKE